MLNKTGLVLQDGTTLDDLIDREMNQVALRVLSDPELHRAEMKRIFARTWQMLGHESEIPRAGDFVVRAMGEDSLIVSRAKDGKIYASLNVCPHRGMRVCTAEVGNAQVHRCIYHGWAFRPDGEFIGAPIEKEQMHGSKLSKAQLRLRQARVETYAGMIFATWNLGGPSLDEYLGEARFYLDQVFRRTDAGIELVGPPQRFIVHANWKTASEQAASDGYHVLTLHRWMMEDGLIGGSEGTIHESTPGMYGVDVAFTRGHSVRCLNAAQTYKMFTPIDFADKSVDERLRLLRPAGITAELLPQLRNNLSDGQIETLATYPPIIGNIFPNFLWVAMYNPRSDGGETGVLSVNTYLPKGPDTLEFLSYTFAEKGASEKAKREMRENSVQQTGISGVVEQDDAEVWPQMQRSSHGAIGCSSTLKYQALQGQGSIEGWKGGGKIFPGFSKDDTQWNWWLTWYEMMSSPL